MGNQATGQLAGVKILVACASFVILIAGLQAAQSILVPFLFAMFLAVIGSAPVGWLQRHRVPAWLAVLIVTIIIASVFIGAASFIGTSVNDFTGNLPRYREKVNEILPGVIEWFRERGVNISTSAASRTVEPGSIFEALSVGMKLLVSALSSTFLVLVIMVFMLFEAASFRLKLDAALGDTVDVVRFRGMTTEVQRYLAIKTVTCMITGILVGLWIWVMGMEFAVLWGFIAFLLNYIPFVGSIIAAIPAIILALAQQGFGVGLTLAIGYIVINIGVSNFLEPVLMGRRLGLSPLVVFLSLVFWGFVWGPAGMLLSVPLTMIIKILLEHSHDFRWIAVLMDVRPVQEKD